MIPSLSVVQTEPSLLKKACALFAAESERSIEQPVDEPFETDRNFPKLSPELCSHPVDHRAAHDRFSDGAFLFPLRPVLVEVENRDRQIVIRREEAAAFRHNPVSIVIGIAGEGDLEAVFQADEPLHGERG